MSKRKKIESERYIYPINIKVKKETYEQLTHFIDRYYPYTTMSEVLREIISKVVEEGFYERPD